MNESKTQQQKQTLPVEENRRERAVLVAVIREGQEPLLTD